MTSSPTEISAAQANALSAQAVAGCCGSGLLGAGLGALSRTGSAARSHHSFGNDAARANRTATGTFVVRGATILTVDDDFSTVDALGVHDGRIIAVGSVDEVTGAARACSDDVTIIDRPGTTILPGFIEPHAHVLPTALFANWTDVGAQRFDTIEAVLTHLTSQAVEGSDAWILGKLFDPSLQRGGDELTTDMLDRVSSEVPVAVLNASLHLAYVNSAALAVAGVNSATPDIEGSPYGRHPDGTPNGILKGQAAMLSVLSHNPTLLEVDLLEGALALTSRASAAGVTTICDQGAGGIGGPDDLDVYANMVLSGRMATRLRYSAMDLRADAFDAIALTPGTGDEMLRAVGWKVIADGSNQGRTGHQREPYLPAGNSNTGAAGGGSGAAGGDCGIAYVEANTLCDIVARRAEQGWQLVIHANGDRAIDDALDAFEALPADLRADRRHRIEHCSFLHDDQIARIAAMGLSPSFLIGHVHYWGQAFRDEIVGPEKAELLDRTASCSAAGIRWTLHSDEMVTPIGPLRYIENAVTRNMWREPDGVLAPQERVDVATAIRAMTADAAWQCHSDGEIGTLEVGKLADFVVLTDDPRAVAPDRIRHIEVLETWLGGEQVHPLPA
ncbi:MAG: amidohydrolase family protein [Candidatus Microthrix parvicella]